MTVYGGLQTGHREKPPGYIMVDGDRLIARIASIIEVQWKLSDAVDDLLDMMAGATDREREELGK